MNIVAGIDIGGTKCALSLGARTADSVNILHREEFPTAGLTWRQVLDEFARRLEARLAADGAHGDRRHRKGPARRVGNGGNPSKTRRSPRVEMVEVRGVEPLSEMEST